MGLFHPRGERDVGGRLAPPNEDAFAQDSMKRSGGTKAAASSEQYLSGPIEMQVDGTRRWQRRGSHAAPATGDVDLRAVAHQSNKSGETIDRIIAAIRGTTILFTDMDRDQLEQVAHAMEEVETEAGQVIIRQGDHGDYFYVIESGEYVAEKDGEPVCTYSGTGSFGELALMYGAPRAASVRVLTSGLLWRLDRTTFRMIVVISNAIRRKRNVELLGNIPAWAGLLTMHQRQSIADCLCWEVYQDGQFIIREGDATNETSKFFILDKGHVKCLRTINGEKQVVRDMDAPAYFGEMAFLEDSGHRFADVVAVGEVQVLGMDKGAFHRLMGPLTHRLEMDVEEMRQVFKELAT